MSKSSTSNQLVQYKNYDVKNSMIFGKAKMGTVGSATFYRIPVQTRYADGKVGDLLFSGPELFSFGLQANMSLDNPDVQIGWLFTLCLHNKDGATPNELAFENKLREVVDNCRDYLLTKEVSESAGKFDLEKSQLKDVDFSFIKHKKDKNTKRVILDSPPMIYSKLIEAKGDGKMENRKILTIFYDKKGKNIDPLTIIDIRGRVKPVLKIESIFVGAKIINVSVKLWEVEFSPVSSVPVALQRASDASDSEEEEDEEPVPVSLKKEVVVSDSESEDSEKPVVEKPVEKQPVPVKKILKKK